jgi:hypothetical protein
MARRTREKDSKDVVATSQNGGGLLSDEQLERLAEKLGEKEIEARERLQVMRDLFPRNLDELLTMGRVPANLVVPLTDYITWMHAGEDEDNLDEVMLTALLRLLIGKDGAARYETLAAYEAHKERREPEEEGEL